MIANLPVHTTVCGCAQAHLLERLAQFGGETQVNSLDLL